MSAEIPFTLREPFCSEPVGIKLTRFAEDLWTLPNDLFPLSSRAAARLLLFEDDRVGAQSITSWSRAGIINLTNLEGYGRLELVVTKLVQIHFAKGGSSFSQVHQEILRSLQGSRLEGLVGQLKPESARKKGRAKLMEPAEDENGFWWIDKYFIRSRGFRNEPGRF